MSPDHRPDVRLREFDDHDSARLSILDAAKQEVVRSFPQSYGGVRMEIDEVDYDDREPFTVQEQKKALLEDRYLAKRLKGTVRLVDEASGERLDEKRITLMRVPWLTQRGTFVHGGNEYTTINQMRLMAGPYTRRQNNGGLETQFNVRPGTGVNFRVGFDPETARYNLKVQQAQLHLYSLMRDVGVPDEELEKRWGPAVLEANRARYDARVLPKAYQRLVPRKVQNPEATREEMAEAVKAALSGSLVSAYVLERNLPIRAASKAATEEAAMEFLPDLAPEEARASAIEQFLLLTKEADRSPVVAFDEAFDPDLDPHEISDSKDRLYLRRKKRLAGMERWPREWVSDQDPMGWLQWYDQYAAGRRSPDDAWQIQRWKSFKARHGQQFRKNPTPRRAWALRNWAIDPLKLVDDPDQRKAVQEQMEQYRRKMDGEEETKQAGGSNASKGCLMLMFPLDFARKFIARSEKLIPAEALDPENGREHQVHVTVLFGFPDRKGVEKEIEDVIAKEVGNQPIFLELGKISRFEGKDGKPDVLKVEVTSPQLQRLNKALRAIEGVEVTWPTYNPHATLAYVKPGSLSELNGHMAFAGEVHRFRSAVYSLPGSTAWEVIEWGSEKVATFRRAELVALARMLNVTMQAGIDENLASEELELAIQQFMNQSGFLVQAQTEDGVKPVQPIKMSP